MVGSTEVTSYISSLTPAAHEPSGGQAFEPHALPEMQKVGTDANVDKEPEASELTKDRTTFDHAITLGRRGLAHTTDLQGRINSLQALAYSLECRYDVLGSITDLSEAIAYSREALSITPPDHSARLGSLDRLSKILRIRFHSRGVAGDLEEALGYDKEGATLRAADARKRRDELQALGSSSLDLFTMSGTLEHGDQAIKYLEEALALPTNDDEDLLLTVAELSKAYLQRLEISKCQDDEQKALKYSREAQKVAPNGSWNQSHTLYVLALILGRRFRRTNDIVDLDECIALGEQAVELCRPGEPRRARRLCYLAVDLRSRLRWLGHIQG